MVFLSFLSVVPETPTGLLVLVSGSGSGGFRTVVDRRKEGAFEGEEAKWEFGGLSADGREGGAVPVCKHLLACVLGERWGVLKGYVKERSVGREEMAGLAGEG